jgi:NAD(P)-dependent dehydrogenase (short-subunit alcohol dehydrogenase family)
MPADGTHPNLQPLTPSPRLTGKAALITGGASGIGRATALLFAAEGARVGIVDRDGDGARAVAAEIGAAGGTCHATVADVSRGDEVDRAVAEVVAALGGLDIVVNNAGVSIGDDVAAIDEATWDYNLAVVLKSQFLVTKAALPALLAAGSASIVNISSVNGLLGLGEEAYSAAKAGVISLTQNLAVRYGGRGVRANVICPGSIRTPIWADRVARDPGVFDRLAAWYPIGRVGEPEEVARVALFLAADESSLVNGAVIVADGGLTAGLRRMGVELQGLPEA